MKRAMSGWYVVGGLLGVVVTGLIWGLISTNGAQPSSESSGEIAQARDGAGAPVNVDTPIVYSLTEASLIETGNKPADGISIGGSASSAETSDRSEKSQRTNRAPAATNSISSEIPEEQRSIEEVLPPTADQIVLFEQVKQESQGYVLDKDFDLNTFMSDPRIATMHASQSHEIIEQVMKGLEKIELKRDQKQDLAKTQ